jgi:hypothetical protein
MINKKNKLILLSVFLSSIILNAGDLTYSNSSNPSSVVKYIVKDFNGVFNYPDTTSYNNITVDGSYSSNLLVNGDLEAGTSNWNVLSGSGFVVDTQSQVNNAGQYMWGKSTSGWTVQQKIDITVVPNAKYFLFDFDYSGWAAKDTVEGFIKFEDADGVLLSSIYNSGAVTGNKDDAFQSIVTMNKNIQTNTAKLIVEVEQVRNSGSDSDGYMDNLSIKVRPNKYYNNTTGNDFITTPVFNKPTYYYANSGNDIIRPVDLEVNQIKSYSYGQQGTDWIFLPVGNLNKANGNGHSDVLIGYQGTSLNTKSKLNGGGSDDKIYAPTNGTGHIIDGGNNNDTVIFKGNKSDYTFTFVTGTEYDVTKSGFDLKIKNVEFVGFTNTNVLSEADYNTYNTEDIWYIDPDTNSLIDSFPETVDDIAKSVTRIKHDISIDNPNNDTYDIYITNIPLEIKYIEDSSGNYLKPVREQTNGDSELKRDVILNLSNTDYKFIEEQNTRDVSQTVNFNNMRITRKLGF